jgi:NhaP-type Na+/H+ or K+/H+ antiporter
MIPLIVVAATLFGYGLLSRRLSSTVVTGPMVFVAVGLILGPGVTDAVGLEVHSDLVQALLEGTLVIVLFTDAAVIDVRAVRRHLALPTRLLTIGLILTIAAGVLLAQLLFGELGFWGAAVIAITLAPTDAALGQAVVMNRDVPVAIRQGLTVESGLNDGVAVPLVSVAIAGVAGEITSVGSFATVFLQEIGIATVVGIGVGFVGAWLVTIFYERGWMTRTWRQISVPVLAIVGFAIATPLQGSGFIAAFVGGLVFGSIVRSRYHDICTFSEAISYLMTMISFLVFGIAILGPAVDTITWTITLYAFASLTVVRMVPVAIALIGAKFSWPTIAFAGWFGPRGLASLVFAGTVVAELDLVGTELTVTVIAATVGLSVLLHGLTSGPLASAYGRWVAGMMGDDPEAAEMGAEAPVRVRMQFPHD